MKLPRWRLFPKYATLIIAVVAGVLVVSGAINLVFSWREIQSHLVALQMEKAQGAAARIEQYILSIEHQLGWTAFPRTDGNGDAIEQRRIEYLKLLKQEQSITELTWIGADGRERLVVSRLRMDVVNSGIDLSKEPAFLAVRDGKTKAWFGPVQFRKGTEPYMAIARPAGSDGARPASPEGVTVADVNLKFVWDVVSRIKVGQTGLAYVVDATGTLIAHPDISLVLKKTDMKSLPQVAALDRPDGAGSLQAHDLTGAEVFSAHVRIPSLDWTVFVETPRAEAFAPLYDSVLRLVLLLIGGLLLAAAESFVLARALVRPIQALQQGAARIGAGELDQHIAVNSGDELEGLAEQFNQMGAALQASYADLERKVDERTRELSEALAYQTAISEVLRVISQSPTDVRPVFEVIMESAQRLFGTSIAAVFRYDGQQVHLIGTRGWSDAAAADARRLYPGPPNPSMMSGRVVLSGQAQTIVDTQADPSYDQATAKAGQWRRMIGAPMLRDDAVLGVIVVAWAEPGETPQRQRDLLQTFASQAVIAIENVRLFNETKEALDRQTATSEVLRVISGSITDTQPVFDIIAERAANLSGAHYGWVFRFDGEWIHVASSFGVDLDGIAAARRAFPMRASGGSIVARAIRQGAVINAPDLLKDPDLAESVRELAQTVGTRSVLSVPMFREQQVIGALTVTRNEPGGFAAKVVDLLSIFASQAVIAIENVRLFNETKDALEQQTATAEVLQVISSSVADTAPVFEKILHSCSHLFESSEQGVVLVGDDGCLHLGAHRGSARERLQAVFPMPLGNDPVARAMSESRVLHYPDVLRDAEPGSVPRRVAEMLNVGSYTQVFAPMRWEGEGVGYLYVIRSPVAPFTDKEIGLLKTFADQAAIAIQNARLFHEIEDKSRQLEAANRHKSEFLANMSHELRTPLNAIIGFSEVLTEQMFGDVNDKQMEYLKDIHSSGQHLLALINDVLDLSKIEAGKMELDLSCFDLGLLLEHSATLVRERAQRHGLALEIEVGDGLTEWVADARKVKQVVVNLLTNAVKFTPNGGRVSVRARHLNGVDGHAGDWAE
ncbi:MAG TPA: GAF domain-containing protein, partial [Burkholderiaceae bacterium]|nr:GAF domain-containing protein [Burkholderiaceae bacterium]